MMKLDVGKVPLMTQCNERVPRRPAWYKAEQEHLDAYTATLQTKLSTAAIPESLHCLDPNCKDEQHSQERDKYILDLLSAIIETSQLKKSYSP